MEPYKCKLCGEEENITLIEYLGAYDGRMAIRCGECDRKTHRNGLEILAEVQGKDYGPVYFLLKKKNGWIIRNKNLFPYSEFNLEDDAIFEDLEESLII